MDDPKVTIHTSASEDSLDSTFMENNDCEPAQDMRPLADAENYDSS